MEQKISEWVISQIELQETVWSVDCPFQDTYSNTFVDYWNGERTDEAFSNITVKWPENLIVFDFETLKQVLQDSCKSFKLTNPSIRRGQDCNCGFLHYSLEYDVCGDDNVKVAKLSLSQTVAYEKEYLYIPFGISLDVGWIETEKKKESSDSDDSDDSECS